MSSVEKMEDIKSTFDEMMENFNESVAHTAPRKLRFENSGCPNDSLTASKKRRLLSDQQPERTSNESKTTLNTSGTVPASPWETRRMKADLIEAKTRISKLKQEIDRSHKVRTEMETLYQNRVAELIKQTDFSAKKIEDVEKHLHVVRQRENAAKQETLKVQKEFNQHKISSDELIYRLQSDKKAIEENAQYMQNCMANELSEYRRHADKLQTELELVTDELNRVKGQLSESKTRASAYDELKLKSEKDQQELESANSRIKELEYEIASYADWKEITKNSQARLLSIPEMTKEMDRLRANNKHLHSLLGNKLLLEEQVHDLQVRLEKEESSKNEAVALQVKFSHMEEELKEWVKVAQDHCLPNVLVSPMALRSRIEQLLQESVVSTSEKADHKSEAKSLDSELQDYKMKVDQLSKNLSEVSEKLKQYKYFKDRLQKKLLFVSRERDFFKQMADTYEKDLTVSNTTTTSTSTDPEVMQLRLRLEMVEKTLVGYKDMCANYERELNSARHMPSVEQMVDAPMADSDEMMKKELDKLRLENEQLLRRRRELELELQSRSLMDANERKVKVVHLRSNPADEAYENSKNQIEKLQAEIERLKRRNKKLEEDHEQSQMQSQSRIGDDTSNLTVNIKEMNKLRSELESANAKMKKLKECYKSANMEFRDVCGMLFGYRIDRVGMNSNYKLSSLYAESRDDYLNFRLNESNVLDMLETPYSATLKSLIETHLVGNKSLPAFLSTLTLELFQRATITIS